MVSNHNNKNHYNNCSGDKQSNSQTLIPLTLFHTKKPITTNAMVRPPIITPSAIWAISAMVTKDHRFDLRFFRPFRADLSIKKSSSSFPPLIAATSQRGLAPRPAKFFRLTDHDISARLSFPSKRLHRLELFGRRQRRQWPPFSPTAFQSRHDACEAFCQPAFAGP